MGSPACRGYIRLRLSRVRQLGLRANLSLVFLSFFLSFFLKQPILDYIQSRRKGFELI